MKRTKRKLTKSGLPEKSVQGLACRWSGVVWLVDWLAWLVSCSLISWICNPFLSLLVWQSTVEYKDDFLCYYFYVYAKTLLKQKPSRQLSSKYQIWMAVVSWDTQFGLQMSWYLIPQCSVIHISYLATSINYEWTDPEADPGFHCGRAAGPDGAVMTIEGAVYLFTRA